MFDLMVKTAYDDYSSVEIDSIHPDRMLKSVGRQVPFKGSLSSECLFECCYGMHS